MTDGIQSRFDPAPPGTHLGVAWPASPCLGEEVEPGAEALRDLGYGIELGAAVEGALPYLAGEDADRARELTNLWEDPDVAGVIAARGGYGCLRTAPYLDFAKLTETRKPLVGFSDLTVFLSALLREGRDSIHGPTLSSLATQPPALINRLADILAGDWALTEPLEGTVLLDQGPSEGYLVGGNLTVLTHLVGTPWQPPVKGGIVFLEDVGEKLYRLDRALTHLLAAGFFSGCRGVVLGGFQGAEYGAVLEMARERLTGLGVSLLAGLPFGHGDENAALRVGGQARIVPEEGSLSPLAGDG
jgi:muramoyltetrapeptide carboxypeptidase